MNNTTKLIIKFLAISALVMGVVALYFSIYNYQKAVSESLNLLSQKQNLLEEYIENTQPRAWSEFLGYVEANNAPAE